MTCGHRTALLPVSVLSCLILQSVAAAQQAPPGHAQQSAPGQKTPAPAARGYESRSVAQGFSVVLVLADLQASTAPDDVPPAARRALADMKDFLPYKSYKLLDAAWILGSGATGTATRLRGPEEQEYELRMSTSSTGGRGSSTPEGQGGRVSNSTVFVRFTLLEAASSLSEKEQVEAVIAEEARRSAETTRAVQERQSELIRLEAELRAAEQQKNEAKVRELRSALARARNRSERTVQSTTRAPQRRSGGPIIDTSFNMDIGETVVVGTSRLKGNSRALIALLTAVPVKGSRLPTEAR